MAEGGVQRWQRVSSGVQGCGRALSGVLRGLLLPLALLALLPACSNLGGPEYQRPAVPAKADWSEGAGAEISAEAIIQPDWWTGFDDPYLNELISRAITDNVDIKILAARSGVAKAAIGQAKAGLLPTLSAGLGTDRLKSSGNSGRTLYGTGSDVIWEIDIWGKVRKGVAAQTADYKATEADWRAGYLAIVADVATAYFQIRRLDEQIARQQATIERNQQIYAIYGQMYDEGLVPRTQVLQQEAELNRLQSNLLELKRLRKLTENALATLLGLPADSLRVPQTGLRSVHAVAVPAGLPSDLMSRRPDIIAAEYRVLQAYNLEGQARLERLPSLSLTGKAGSASFALVDLLKSWTLGLSSLASIPIFDPSITAGIQISEAQTKVVEEEYRRTVLGAFEEVENALTNLAARKAQTSELSSRRANLVTVSEQVYAQLEEGMVSQLEVFEVERSLLDAEQEMLANHWLVLTDTIALFKALGGGWPREVVSSTSF